MRYETAVPLGHGAMGEVFKAYDPQLGRFVALKYLRWHDPMLAARLLREARLQARVAHDSICQVYEVGTEEGRPFIAMQYIDGETLDVAAAQMGLEERLRVVRDVALAVHAAHETGLIHRDLKPQNIMVERRPDGPSKPYVLDFGLAREAEAAGLTQTGAIVGTPAYMSPEQARGEVHALDRRTDVYALGAVLYRLVAGRPPFEGSDLDVAVQVVHAEPVPPSRLVRGLPADVETIILKCLEKEPWRRYDSARALAEDLGRYLAGEPVTARPTSLAYRLARRARAHPVTVVAASAALMVTAALGLAWMRSRWAAAEQARLAQHFGQEVERIDGTLQTAYLLPLHDVRPHKARIRARLQAIEADMARGGRLARAPGLFALGRGHLALGEFAPARSCLQQAWDLGDRGPDVALALGRALGGLYAEALDAAQRTGNRELREQRRKEAEEAFRDPALAALRAAGKAGDQPLEYVPALIAFYERRYDDALRETAAAARVPGFYQANLLAGRVDIARGRERHERGDYAGALADYERAGRAQLAALEVARSDPEAYDAECLRLLMVLEAQLRSGSAVASTLSTMNVSCDAAIRADPDRASPYKRKARALWRWAERQTQGGEDTQATLAGAVAAGREAARLDPRDPDALSTLATALWGQGDADMRAGRDGLVAFRDAARFYEAALVLRPNERTAVGNLAGLYQATALYETARGIDPNPSLDRAVETGLRATELMGTTLAAPYTNLALTYWARAAERLEHGLDTKDALSQARQVVARGLQINPNNVFAHQAVGQIELTAAQDAVERGADPGPWLERVEEAARRALAIDPTFSEVRADPVRARAIEAEYLLAVGRSPDGALREGRQAFAVALSANPHQVDALVARARLEIAAGRWAVRQGRSPEGAVEAALAAAERATRLNPRRADAYRLEAEACRRRAAWRAARGGDAAADVARGLRAARQAVSLNPRLPKAMAEEAALLALAAHRERGPAAARLQAEARELLGRAIALNARLRAAYEPVAGGGTPAALIEAGN